MNINENQEERRKSDRYAQFYTKSITYQTETQYEEPTERNRQKKSSKSTSLSISAIFISFMALLTSFIAIAIASIKPKEVVVEKEAPVYQDVEEERNPGLHQEDFDATHVPQENEITSETTIERQVVFSQDSIIITATGIEFNSSFIGPEIKFLIENNTEENIIVQARNVSVNGYMVDTTMSAEVSSGKKTNDSLTIDNSSLEECGIEDIAYIDFSFNIFNDDSWDDFIDTEMIHIETSIANRYSEKEEQHGVIGVEVQKSEEEQYGSIEDFSYDLLEDTIILKKYTGSAETLEIQSSYTIDGTEYRTDLSEFQIGIGNRKVKTLILDDGITEVRDAIFNSTYVERVYFPKSMTIVYDNTLSYLHPNDGETIKVYYGGTQEEWAEIFAEYKRTLIEDAEFGEEMGQAAADKLNEMIGMEYDSSLFEYFFSAIPDDLK